MGFEEATKKEKYLKTESEVNPLFWEKCRVLLERHFFEEGNFQLFLSYPLNL